MSILGALPGVPQYGAETVESSVKTVVGPLQTLIQPQLSEIDKYGSKQLDRVWHGVRLRRVEHPRSLLMPMSLLTFCPQTGEARFPCGCGWRPPTAATHE
jgi:hypothetical protein